MREHLIQSWPAIRSFLLGVCAATILAVLLHLGAVQKIHHADVRQAIRGNDIAWEVCRAAMGQPAHHEGGGWIKTDGLSLEDLDRAATSVDGWAWTDAAGKLTAWPGHEDDTANDADDACSEAWRAGYSVATDEGGQP